MYKRLLVSLLLVTMMIASAGADQVTYSGSAQGFGSQVKVDVTLENGKVVDLKADDSGETYTMAGVTREGSVEKVIAAIIAAGGTEGVDATSGATFTSKAIISVVNEALAGGKADLSGVKIEFKPGTYTGHGKGRAGDIEVSVTVTSDRIEKIEVGKNGETVGVKDLAFVGLRDEILANQSLGVDSVSGATMTSNGFINAVTDALTQASNQNVVAALKAVKVAHEVPAAENIETQVVVVGAGMSGLIASLTAAQLGANVVLVEKMPFTGGNLFLAGGGLGTVGAEVVDANDDLERTLNYFKMVNATSERQPDYDFIAKMLPETGRAIDWLVKDFGLSYGFSDRGDYVRTNFGTPEDRSGSAFAKQLDELNRKQGVKILLNTRAERILIEDGKAAGVVVSNEAGEFTIKAQKVILATGGASRNWERMTKANPELNVVKFFEEASVSSTGDGFDMREAIGAKMDVPLCEIGLPGY